MARNTGIVKLILKKSKTIEYIFISSVIKIEAKNPDRVAFNLIAIVDPVSRGAQKLGPILNTLQQSLNCNIKIFLNCMDKNSDMPLKR